MMEPEIYRIPLDDPQSETYAYDIHSLETIYLAYEAAVDGRNNQEPIFFPPSGIKLLVADRPQLEQYHAALEYKAGSLKLALTCFVEIKKLTVEDGEVRQKRINNLETLVKDTKKVHDEIKEILVVANKYGNGHLKTVARRVAARLDEEILMFLGPPDMRYTPL